MVSPDTNTIPVGGVDRIEVLRDGASPIHGADAIAGVVNTYLKGDLDGGFPRGTWRASDGTSLYRASINGGFGMEDSFGFDGDYHSPKGRQFMVQIGKKF